MRPIVSFCGSPTYQLSKYLTNVLKPLTDESRHKLQSTENFIDNVKTRENESRERIPLIIFLNLFKVRVRAAKVIFVCCFRDPRGLLSRERDMFRRQTFEV